MGIKLKTVKFVPNSYQYGRADLFTKLHVLPLMRGTGENPMPFNVGDVVCVLVPDVVRQGRLARVEQVLPKRHSVQDFQEYIVEFPNEAKRKFRYCMYREF